MFIIIIIISISTAKHYRLTAIVSILKQQSCLVIHSFSQSKDHLSVSQSVSQDISWLRIVVAIVGR